MVIDSDRIGMCMKCKMRRPLSSHHIVPRREILRFHQVINSKVGWPANRADLCRECHLDYEKHSKVRTHVKSGIEQTTLIAIWHTHFNNWLLDKEPALEPETTSDADRDEIMRETIDHVRLVGFYLADMVHHMMHRAVDHDRSKFDAEEFPTFVAATPRLRASTYGSAEYKKTLEAMGPALQHHYNNNRHHPEFHEHGVNDMTLLDLIEMLCDWKAATERHADGNMAKSIASNRHRFRISEQLDRILLNTATELGWV